MKILILLFLAFGFIGIPVEYITIILMTKMSIKEKLDKLKILLMFPVYGGACVLMGLLYKIPFLQDIKNLALLMLFGMIIADLFELGYGILFNKVLKLNIWNYSDSKITVFGKVIPLNLWGQIDLVHSLLWAGLTVVVINFTEIIKWLAR